MQHFIKATKMWLFLSFFFYLAPSLARKVVGPSSTKIIESFHVKTDIRFRFATTQMVSVVRNIADNAQEIGFDVTLPKEAFIVNFSMAIDGKEYVGEVKEKGEAKRQYQSAVDRGQSAGHVRQAPRHSNVFEVSVNVANGSAITFTLTYQELLRRKLGLYEHEIHVSPGQAVQDFSIEIFIQENRKIPMIRTPALRKDVLLTNEVEAENELAVIERPTPETAHIKFAPSLTQQGYAGVSARFAVQYDVDHSDEGEVLVADGYFLHFFAPDVPSLPKDIIFVLDVSGSMAGGKIEQLKLSMMTILKDLTIEDRFNILTFSNTVYKWKSDLANAIPSVIQEATTFVQKMHADGGTNINQALLRAVEELRGRELTTRVGMIFFLTDGEPTSGETNKPRITANVRNSNNNSASIFGLAFGSNADYNILKTICGQNLGFARKIYEASDSALQVASLYKEISAVAMKNVKVKYLPSISKTTDTDFPVVFNGSEIIICGLVDDRSTIFEAMVSGTEKSGSVDVVLSVDNVNEFIIDMDDSLNTFFTIPRDYSGIVEKMWAFLTIKQLLKEKELVIQDEQNAEKLKKEILAMSLKYNFVTPLTSMVVTKPGEEDKEEKVESGLEDVDDVSNRMLGSQGRSRLKGRTGSPRVHYRKSADPAGYSRSYARRRLKKNRGFRMYSSMFPMAGHVPQSGQHGLHMLAMYDPSADPFSQPVVSRRYIAATHTAGLIVTTTTPGTTTTHRTTTTQGTTTTHRTTTTQGTTTTSSQKKPGNNNEGKRRTKKVFPVLSSLVVRSSTSSGCISPRRIMKGTYTLLERTDGQLKIELGTDCGKKKCRLVLADGLNFTYNGDKAVIKLSSVNVWHYTQGQLISVILVSKNQLKITTPIPTVEVLITKTKTKRKVLYDIEVIMESQDTYRGLLEKLQKRMLKLKQKNSRKPKVPKSCQSKRASFSMKLHKKLAKKFMQ